MLPWNWVGNKNEGKALRKIRAVPVVLLQKQLFGVENPRSWELFL